MEAQKNDVLLSVRFPQRLIDRIDDHRTKLRPVPSRQQIIRDLADDYLRRKAEGGA